MLYHETYLCSLLNTTEAFAYGFEFKYLSDKPEDQDRGNILGEQVIFDIQVGRVMVGMEDTIDQEYLDKAWVADAFVESVTKPGTIIGFQVSNDRGECYGDRPTFEVICADTACQELIEARSKNEDWVLSAVYEGDIEEPTFSCETSAFTRILIQA